jgi:hypothetical protein
MNWDFLLLIAQQIRRHMKEDALILHDMLPLDLELLQLSGSSAKSYNPGHVFMFDPLFSHVYFPK